MSASEDEASEHEQPAPTRPQEIETEDIAIDVDFSAANDIIAVCDISGQVTCYKYSIEENFFLWQLNVHRQPCRALSFSDDGTLLFTASKDKSIRIIDVENAKVTTKFRKAHESPIYSLLFIDDYLLVTGDDDGTVKLWDYRAGKCTMTSEQCEDYISDLATNDTKKIVLATSGEGTLSAFNVRAKRFDLQSELMDSELLSLAVVKNGEKVVCGTGDGALNIFNWNEWGNICDRFPIEAESIDCMVVLNDEIIVTGSADGQLRAIHLYPNRYLYPVGNCDGFPVENLDVSRDGRFIAACGHEAKVRFWNVERVYDEVVDTTKLGNTKNKADLKRKRNNFYDELL